jgi:prepilin-type N-terminal cleavage/methylation domain-containing protein
MHLPISRKGFTIVELAIVLVVIGIILAMAEIAKFQKVETGLSIYFLKTNGNAQFDHTGYFLDTIALINEGIISAKDLEASFGATSTTSDNSKVDKYKLDLCGYLDDLSTNPLNAASSNKGRHISANMPLLSICALERTLDDENSTTGEATVYARGRA